MRDLLEPLPSRGIREDDGAQGLSVQGAVLLYYLLAENIINVGVIGPMTGPAAEIGSLMSGACYAAVLDVNKAGGVLGRKISCALVDDTGDPADAVPNVTRALATTSNLNMAVGLESNTAATTIPLVNGAHIPMVSTNGLVAYDKTRDAYFWRMTPSDDQNGAAFVAWAARKGDTRVAVVFQNNIGAQGNDPGVVAAVRKSGGTMTTNITIPGDASSYSSVVARVIGGKPEAGLVGQIDGSHPGIGRCHERIIALPAHPDHVVEPPSVAQPGLAKQRDV